MAISLVWNLLSSVDGSDHQVALNNVTFSIADAGAVASADAKIEVKARDGVSAISGNN